MNWNLFLKYLGYAFVISLYGLFAWTGRAPVEGFLVVLTGVLALLGGSHIASSAAKDSADTATKMASIAAPPDPPAKHAIAPTIVVRE